MKKLKKLFRSPKAFFRDASFNRALSRECGSDGEFFIDFKSDFLAKEFEEFALFSDVEKLRKLSYCVLINDFESFELLFESIFSSLKLRLGEECFDVSDVRFKWVASAVSSLAGCLHIYNQDLIDAEGRLLPESCFKNCTTLVISLLDCLERENFVFTQESWLDGDFLLGAHVRNKVAQSVSYLARDCYIFSNQKYFFGLISRLKGSHSDILLASFSMASIRIVDREDVYFKAVVAEYESLYQYLHYQRLAKNYFLPKLKSEGDLWKKFVLFSKVSVQLNQCHKVSEFKVWFYKDGCDQEFSFDYTFMLPIILSSKQLYPCFEERFSRFVLKETVGLFAQKISYLMSTGRRVEAENFINDFCLPEIFSVSECYHLLNLISSFPGLFDVEKNLKKIKNSLLKRWKSGLHDVNYMARLLQFNRVCKSFSLLDEANEAYDKLHDVLCLNEKRQQEDSVVLFCINQCRVTPALMLSVMPYLLEQKIGIYNLEENGFENSIVKKWPYSSQYGLKGRVGGLLNDGWQIDLEGRILEFDGVNYFQGMYERVSRVLKVFSVPWDLPVAQVYFRIWLVEIDALIFSLEGVRNSPELKAKKVYLVSLQSHFVPWFALKEYAQKYSEMFNHITLSSSYESWATNVSGGSLSTLTLKNDTVDYSPSIPAFGNKIGFDSWLDLAFKEKALGYAEITEGLVSVSRSGVSNLPNGDLFDFLREKKQEGRMVFCALGKIPYDLAVRYQGGPAHKDMGDWIKHTVSSFSENENVLLVKPHPHELKLEISGKPVEGFLDLISEPVSENVRFLPHLGVNLQDLFEYVDVFLCWNGSSIAELGSQGKVVVACDDWAEKNYPIDVFLPENRTHYEAILKGSDSVSMHPDFQFKSSAYVAYLTEAPFSVRLPFVTRSSTNKNFNEAEVDLSAIDKQSLASLKEGEFVFSNSFFVSLNENE